MNELIVYPGVHYIPASLCMRRSNSIDYLLANFVYALKNDPLTSRDKGSFWGEERELSKDNQHVAYQWYAQWVLEQEIITPNTTTALLPIPSSKHTVENNLQITGPILMAQAIKDAWDLAYPEQSANLRCVDYFRWTKEMTPSSEGGSRDPDELLKFLTRNPQLPSQKGSKQVILVDDVITTGAHVKAASRYLQDKEIPVFCALVGGKTYYMESGDLPSLDSMDKVDPYPISF